MKNFFFLLFLLGVFSVTQLSAQSNEASKFEWKKVVVGGGGYVSGVVFSEAAKNVVYCRTDVGGAYRWEPTNSSWIQLLDGVGRSESDLRCVESIAADPSDSSRLYMACGGWTGSSVGGIYWSTDQGRTLNYVNTPFKMAGNNSGRGIGERLQIDPNSPNILYYGSRVHGLFKSTNYAKTWTKIGTFPITTTTDGGGLCLVVFDQSSSTKGTPSQNIYVAVSQNGYSLYKSIDAGSTWSLVAGTPTTLQPHGAVMDTSGIMYLTYGSGTGPGTDGTGAVWKYNTRTDVWTNITPNSASGYSYGGFGGVALDKQKTTTVVVSTAVNWSGGAKIFRSINGGTTWKAMNSNWALTSPDAPYLGNSSGNTGAGNWIESIKIDPFDSNRIMYVTGASVVASSDATMCDAGKTTHWVSNVKGIEEAGAYHIISPPSGTAVLFTNWGDICGFRHTDLNTSPTFASWFGWGYGHGLDFAQNNPNILVRNDGYAKGFISNNNGVSWTLFANQAVTGAGSNGEKIQISANGTSIIWSPENAAPYYSKDGGKTWTVCAGAPAGNNSITSDRVNDNKFYYYLKSTGYIYVSTDGGANFNKAGFAATWGQRISANPWVEGDIWIPVYGQGTNGVFHSVNSGASFTKLGSMPEASSVSLGKNAPDVTYATLFANGRIGTQWGIFYSKDQGISWARINDDAHEYGWIDYVVADQRVFGRVFLSPNCMGVPYCQLKPDTLSSIQHYTKKNDIRFYPNPFTDSITLTASDDTEYKIMSLDGKVMESGLCNTNFEIGSSIPSGMYLLKIANGNKVESAKIIKQ